jgi:hypothetical protein
MHNFCLSKLPHWLNQFEKSAGVSLYYLKNARFSAIEFLGEVDMFRSNFYDGLAQHIE